MIIFIIFVSIVLLSLILQWLSKRWLIATGVPCSIFSLLMLTGTLSPKHAFPALVLGLPMIFFASLLGSYLYETKLNPERHNNIPNENNEDVNNIKKSTSIKENNVDKLKP